MSSLRLTLPWDVIASCQDLCEDETVTVKSSVSFSCGDNSGEKTASEIQLTKHQGNLQLLVQGSDDDDAGLESSLNCTVDSDVITDASEDVTDTVTHNDLDDSTMSKSKEKSLSKSSDVPRNNKQSTQTRNKSGSMKIKKFFWEKDKDKEQNATKKPSPAKKRKVGRPRKYEDKDGEESEAKKTSPVKKRKVGRPRKVKDEETPKKHTVQQSTEQPVDSSQEDPVDDANDDDRYDDLPTDVGSDEAGSKVTDVAVKQEPESEHEKPPRKKKIVKTRNKVSGPGKDATTDENVSVKEEKDDKVTPRKTRRSLRKTKVGKIRKIKKAKSKALAMANVFYKTETNGNFFQIAVWGEYVEAKLVKVKEDMFLVEKIGSEDKLHFLALDKISSSVSQNEGDTEDTVSLVKVKEDMFLVEKVGSEDKLHFLALDKISSSVSQGEGDTEDTVSLTSDSRSDEGTHLYQPQSVCALTTNDLEDSDNINKDVKGYFTEEDGRMTFHTESDGDIEVVDVELSEASLGLMRKINERVDKQTLSVKIIPVLSSMIEESMTAGALKNLKSRLAKRPRKKSRKRSSQTIWENKKLCTVRLDATGPLEMSSCDDDQYPFEFGGVFIRKDAKSFTKEELKKISMNLTPEKIVVAICPLCKIVLNQNMSCHMTKVHHGGLDRSFVSLPHSQLVPRLESILKQVGEKNVDVVIQCPFCSAKHQSGDVLEHLRTEHPTDITSDEMLSKEAVCKMIRTCKPSDSSPEEPRITRLRYIVGSHKVYCPFCDKLISRQAASHHINTFCSGNLMRSEHFHCKECMHVSINEADFLAHHKKHHADRRYVCQYCARSFPKKQQFFSHLRHKHRHGKNIPKEPIVCSEEGCGYTTFLPVRMTQHHTRMHAKERSFPCDLCEETFPLRESLAKHLYVAHQRVPAHSCPGCARLFLDLQAFQRHTTSCLQLDSPQAQIDFKKTESPMVQKVFTGQGKAEDDEIIDKEKLLEHLHNEELKSVKREAGKGSRKRGAGVIDGARPRARAKVVRPVSRPVDDGALHIELQQVDTGLPLDDLMADGLTGDQYVYIMEDDTADGGSYVIQTAGGTHQPLTSDSLVVTADEEMTQPDDQLVALDDEQLQNLPAGTEIVVYVDDREDVHIVSE